MAGSVKRRSRAEQQEDTRRALLDAAIELFVERGVEATSIEEVTARAGFSRGAFYSNFESKDELFLDACRRFLDELHDAARPEPDDGLDDAGRAHRERLSRVRSVVGDSASVFLAEIALYAIRHPALIDGVAEAHQEQLQPAMAFVRATFGEAGVTDEADVERFANAMQSLTFGLHLFSKIDPTIDPEKTVEVIMTLVRSGLDASSRTPRTRR